MFSPVRKEDKELLLEISETIETLVRVGTRFNKPEALDLAEKLGDNYITLQEKIKTYDYTKDDELYYKLEDLKC